MRHYGCRLMQVTYCGMRTLFIENAALRVGVLLDKGAEIFSFLYKPRDIDFLWHRPGGPRSPAAHTPTIASAGGSFGDLYSGGWQELFPTASAACNFYGAEMGQHGEVALLPWSMEVLADTPGEVSVRLSVRAVRTPFTLARTLTLRGDAPVLHIEGCAANESRVPLDVMWGHHPAFGAPFLDAHCIIDTNARRIRCDDAYATCHSQPGDSAWPRAAARTGGQLDMSRVPAFEDGVAEMAFLYDFPGAAAWYALTNAAQRAGFGMAWDAATFPWLWYWLMAGGDARAPFYSSAYAVALEPFSSGHYPYDRAVAAGDALHIAPGESKRVWLRAVAYEGIERVQEISAAGEVR
ncbi:MAG: aldose 1-epimerase [Anaerolineae bacterium]|nr:aldose 1-epimerase [Anaerolineae bacterium]